MESCRTLSSRAQERSSVAGRRWMTAARAVNWKWGNRRLEIIAVTSVRTRRRVRSEFSRHGRYMLIRCCRGCSVSLIQIHVFFNLIRTFLLAGKRCCCFYFWPQHNSCHVALAQSEGWYLAECSPQRPKKAARPGISKVEWMRRRLTVHLCTRAWGCGVDPGTRSSSGWKE